MFPAACKTRLATALAGAALASALIVSGASAIPAEQLIPRTGDSAEMPPPSSMAASAAEEYKDLRNPNGATTPQSGSQDLRPPDTRDQAEGYSPTLEPQPVAGQPSEPSGFDLVSAAIGALAAGALSLVLMATFGMRKPSARRAASA